MMIPSRADGLNGGTLVVPAHSFSRYRSNLERAMDSLADLHTHLHARTTGLAKAQDARRADELELVWRWGEKIRYPTVAKQGG